MAIQKKSRSPQRRRQSKDGIPRVVLASLVQRQIDRLDLSRNDAAKVVDDAASQVSRMMTGHVFEFSSDRMVEWLTRLGADVTITIRHARRVGRRGKVRVQEV